METRTCKVGGVTYVSAPTKTNAASLCKGCAGYAHNDGLCGKLDPCTDFKHDFIWVVKHD